MLTYHINIDDYSMCVSVNNVRTLKTQEYLNINIHRYILIYFFVTFKFKNKFRNQINVYTFDIVMKNIKQYIKYCLIILWT